MGLSNIYNKSILIRADKNHYKYKEWEYLKLSINDHNNINHYECDYHIVMMILIT